MIAASRAPSDSGGRLKSAAVARRGVPKLVMLPNKDLVCGAAIVVYGGAHPVT